MADFSALIRAVRRAERRIANSNFDSDAMLAGDRCVADLVYAIKALEAERDAWQATADHHYKEAFALRADVAGLDAALERARELLQQARENPDTDWAGAVDDYLAGIE